MNEGRRARWQRRTVACSLSWGILGRRDTIGKALVAVATGGLLAIDGVIVDDGTPLMPSAMHPAASVSYRVCRGPIRLVIKSRRRLVRDAFCAYLAGRPEYTVVGQTGTIEALADLCRLRRPDVALVDAIELNRRAVDDLLRVHAAAPTVELVVAYAEASPEALRAAAGAGITALLPCSRGLEAVLRRVREQARPETRRRPDGVALTESDIAILSLMSSGHNVAEMARLLHVSPRTVENHKRRLFPKLNVRNAGHAVARAASLGLVEMPGAGGRTGPEERGRAPLVVVRGQPGPAMEAVTQEVLAAALPFVLVHVLTPLDHEPWAQWQRGPIVTVLVDPTYDDWLVPDAVGGPTMVVLSSEPDLPTVIDLLLRGAHALIPVQNVTDDLAVVLPAVAHGYLAIDAAHLDDVAGWMTVRLAGGAAAMPALTARERDMLVSMSHGNTIRQTARELGITAKTVENTQARLYRKLGVHNRTEALTISHRLGLLESPNPDEVSYLP
jgi:DNA-binding NarL/FixJ family response regulator